MKTIFLLAKYIAIKENSEQIELVHLKKALSSLEIISSKAKEIVEKIETSQEIKIYYEEENLLESLKAPAKKFSDDVGNIKKDLEKEGLTFDDKISKLRIKIEQSLSLESIKNLKGKLKEILYEQDMAVEAIADSLIRNQYILNLNKPKGTFLFSGDIGSGKSFAARNFANLMNEQGYEFKLFNMSSYTSDNESFVLNGLSRGYSGAKEGELTQFVRKHPKSIILFDSIEKAHNNVVNSLNEILDSGFMLDNYTNEKIDFRESILIFETNSGQEIFLKSDFQKILKEDSFSSETMLLESIAKEKVPGYKDLFILPREFLSRLVDTSIVIFNKLTFNSCIEILKKQIIEEQLLLKKNFNIELEIENFDEIIKMLVLSSGPDYSIRKILKKAPYLIFDPVTDSLLDENNNKKVLIKSDNSFRNEFVELLKDNDEKKLLHNLFRKNKTGVFELDIQSNSEFLTITIKNFLLKTVKKVSDFGGENGIIVEIPDLGFEKIAGHEKVKDRLNEIIKILKNRELNKEYSEFISKGMLLYGVPGTGKTMLAKAFAKEADLPFIATTGPDLLSEEAIKNVFSKAKQYAPAIVFIDEVDVFKHRGKGYGTDILINKLLTEIDGFSNKDEERIFIIAATNLKDEIDNAILRSGRIDLHVEVDTLDKNARKFFIENFLVFKRFSKEIDVEKIIKMTAGFSGADLRKLERESILDAYRRSLELIDENLLIDHINIIKFGEIIENSQSIRDALEQTAYHEAGHALVSKLLFPDKIIEQITIVPRKKSLGFVSYEFKEDIQYDINELKNLICVSLAGRISECKKFNDSGINSGASNDLDKVAHLSYMIVSEYAMFDNIKFSYFVENNLSFFKEKQENKIELIIKEMENKTKLLIDENWEKIENISARLLEKETLYKEDLNELFKN